MGLKSINVGDLIKINFIKGKGKWKMLIIDMLFYLLFLVSIYLIIVGVCDYIYSKKIDVIYPL